MSTPEPFVVLFPHEDEFRLIIDAVRTASVEWSGEKQKRAQTIAKWLDTRLAEALTKQQEKPVEEEPDDLTQPEPTKAKLARRRKL